MKIFDVLFRKINTLFKKPKVIGIKIIQIISPLLSDKLYLKLLFPLKVGYKLNLENPQTFNEKLQWLKLFYRRPDLSRLVDKYEVKNHVKSLIGDQYIIPTLGVWNSFDDVNFNQLPDKFVLKTTHDQGGVVICTNKTTFDYKKAEVKLNRHLKRNFYLKFREWPYKNVRPRIIAEKFIEDSGSSDLKDYKFFCFNGKPEILFVATERQRGSVKFNFYNMDFEPLDIIQAYPKSKKIIEKPENFELMKNLARKLSKGLPQVRVDFYNLGGDIIFGEYTFFHHMGMVPFHPKKWDYILGDYIKLPQKK